LAIGIVSIIVVLRLPCGLVGFFEPYLRRFSRWPKRSPVPAPAKMRSSQPLAALPIETETPAEIGVDS
jgi:hypothetical protein